MMWVDARAHYLLCALEYSTLVCCSLGSVAEEVDS